MIFLYLEGRQNDQLRYFEFREWWRTHPQADVYNSWDGELYESDMANNDGFWIAPYSDWRFTIKIAFTEEEAMWFMLRFNAKTAPSPLPSETP